jgi:alkanesulfonate monooxygenase SsuD/methylene tetrahydromethanopterin reductase-like flavin-dependent oxidoreductase (luciferase family)
MHFVDTSDPAKARAEQRPAFLKVMSTARGADYLESVYLFGTPDEIVEQLQARVEAGIGYFMLHTMTPDVDQLDLWVKHIVPNITFPADAPTRGPVAVA